MQKSTKIKVLECIRQGKIGGGESHLLSLVENLNRDYFEPVVLSFTEGPMIERLHQLGVNTHVIYTEKPFDITKWRKVRKLLKEEKIDIVHAHGTRAQSNVIWAARSLKIPVIYTVHGWSFHQDQHPALRNIRVLGEKYLTSRSTVNVSVSASNKESGKSVIKNFESVTINNGIDHRKFSPGRDLKNIREELGIEASDKLLLFIARFTHQKQPLLLLRAFREALAIVPGLHLLMVGDGDQKSEALQLVNQEGLSDKVTFQAFRQDVPDVLAAADIFVLPSLWEGLPIGLLEAMAMGNAIIATDVDGTREVIQHTENGLLIEPGNATELTNAIIRLAQDEALSVQLKKNARTTVRERYDAGFMTLEIENLYKKLLHGI